MSCYFNLFFITKYLRYVANKTDEYLSISFNFISILQLLSYLS